MAAGQMTEALSLAEFTGEASANIGPDGLLGTLSKRPGVEAIRSAIRSEGESAGGWDEEVSEVERLDLASRLMQIIRQPRGVPAGIVFRGIVFIVAWDEFLRHSKGRRCSDKPRSGAP